MRAVTWCFFSPVLLATLTMMHSDKAQPVKTENGPVVSHGFAVPAQNTGPSAHRSLHRRRHRGRRGEERAVLAHGGSLEPDYWPLQGGAEVEGLTPVRLELGSSAWGDTGGSEGSEERPHGHNVGHKRRHGGDWHRPKHTTDDCIWREKGSAREHNHSIHPLDRQKVLERPNSTTSETSMINEERNAQSPPLTKPQQVEGEAQRDLAPRLHMVLFDKTDSKDTRPLNTGPSHTNTDKENALEGKRGNQTDTDRGTTVPCDHHVDCPLGSCCDLRKHICEVHNRSLNNKCYADCMCEEGFRCYTKFHRDQRVKQKRGRCVDPDTVNTNLGAFITV
ncbi:draxin-A-like isoform X3 [Clupea harengus]|uniref:Draxin-A-like isoform X3 n=1 Tax=Clupea harengus TaxID=7950 RepID=A0A6P8EYU6_CLUHA|nr:draxin-A-like isoform X3 [Clupea harengus]